MIDSDSDIVTYSDKTLISYKFIKEKQYGNANADMRRGRRLVGWLVILVLLLLHVQLSNCNCNFNGVYCYLYLRPRPIALDSDRTHIHNKKIVVM